MDGYHPWTECVLIKGDCSQKLIITPYFFVVLLQCGEVAVYDTISLLQVKKDLFKNFICAQEIIYCDKTESLFAVGVGLGDSHFAMEAVSLGEREYNIIIHEENFPSPRILLTGIKAFWHCEDEEMFLFEMSECMLAVKKDELLEPSKGKAFPCRCQISCASSLFVADEYFSHYDPSLKVLSLHHTTGVVEQVMREYSFLKFWGGEGCVYGLSRKSVCRFRKSVEKPVFQVELEHVLASDCIDSSFKGGYFALLFCDSVSILDSGFKKIVRIRASTTFALSAVFSVGKADIHLQLGKRVFSYSKSKGKTVSREFDQGKVLGLVLDPLTDALAIQTERSIFLLQQGQLF